MDAATIRQTMKDMWDAYNRHDIDGFVGFCAEDIAVRDVGGLVINSRVEFKDYVRAWFDFSTDVKVTVVRTIVDGSFAAAELHLEGTHNAAPLFGVEPTGLHLVNTWAIHVEIVDGLVGRLNIFSNAGLPAQLGIMAAPPVRPA